MRATALLLGFMTVGCNEVLGITQLSDDAGSDGCQPPSSSSFSCPAIGDMNCPNDSQITAGDLAQCIACRCEFELLSNCIGTTHVTELSTTGLGFVSAQCSANGYSVAAPIPSICTSQSSDLTGCRFAHPP